MNALRQFFPRPFSGALVLLFACNVMVGAPVRVRHAEGVTFGFLVLRDLSGEAIAYGDLKEVVKPDDPIILSDLQFHFKDGSYYREITRFTQRSTFRLISDQVTQKGPAFKHQSESWVEVEVGKITFRSLDAGKEKQTTKHLNVPADASNGLLMTLAKNLDPSAAETVVSMVAASSTPRVVEMHITPAPEKTVKVGSMEYKAQHYVVHVKIPGAAGAVAPLIGKQPPDIHLWILKSEAPTFIEYEGPLSEDTPVWRIELMAPERDVSSARRK
jgi:hypothetical protein